MKSPLQVRETLLEFVARDLIGPAGGDLEVLDDSPKIRYAAGILFPQESVRNESVAAGGVETEAESEGGVPASEAESADVGDVRRGGEAPKDREAPPEPEYDETVTLANTYRPSAMALSFRSVGLSPTMRRMSSSSQYFQSPKPSRAKSLFDALYPISM